MTVKVQYNPITGKVLYNPITKKVMTVDILDCQNSGSITVIFSGVQ